MLFLNFNETVNAAMNELAETNRNIGLLETSISMQSFSAVAMETQADAAELMISDEISRKESIIEHLFELHTECIERMQEVNDLIKSANDEHDFYLQEERTHIAQGDLESANICQTLKVKAFNAATVYHQEWNNLYTLSKQIMSTIAGESSPRTLPVTTTDDLPFASEQPAAKAISREQFSEAVNALLEKQEVLSSIEQYCNLDAGQLASSLKENSRSDKQRVKSALEYAIYGSAQDEATADALTDAIDKYFESIVDDVQEALKEYAAPLPSQRRIDANIGGVYRR